MAHISAVWHAYFQPMANPQDGSRNRVAQDEKDPARGKMTASSPRAWHVQKSIAPTIEKATSSEAGPPLLNDLPDTTNSPVPVTNVSRPVGRKLDFSTYLSTLLWQSSEGASLLIFWKAQCAHSRELQGEGHSSGNHCALAAASTDPRDERQRKMSSLDPGGSYR